MTLKEQVYHRCKELVNEKIFSLERILNDLRESAANETKSTAGDKHETALAMLQIEQENTGRQLQQVLQQKLVLDKINMEIVHLQVANGSLVKTNQGYLFICVALGKINVGQTNIIVISPQSPLGAKLLGLKINDTIEMNGRVYKLENIE